MAEWILLKEAAELIGESEGDTRIVLRFHNVKTREAAKKPGANGRAPKEFFSEDVLRVKSLKG